ncbi:hypothetical protein SGCOL_003683 [Colletotrichum sp. CLE4]
MKHAMVMELTDGKLLHAPMGDSPSKIIDRGTGIATSNLEPLSRQDFSANVQCDDGTMPEDWPLLGFWSKIRDAMHKMKIDIQVALRIGALMRDAGFVNVEAKSYKVPVGRRPLDKTKRMVGHYMRSVTEDFLGAAASKPLAALGMDRTEIEVFLASVRNAIKDPEVHAYGTYYSWVGQKPVGSGHE